MTFKFLNKNSDVAKLQAQNAALATDNQNLLTQLKELEAKNGDMDKTIAALPLAQEGFSKQLDEIKAQHATELASLNTTIAALKAEHSTTVENTNKDWQTKVEVLNKQITELQAEKDKLVEDNTKALAAASEVKAEDVNKQVAIKISSLGLNAGEIPAEPIADATTPQAVLAHYKTLSGKERTDYYNAHRREIMHAADGNRSSN